MNINKAKLQRLLHQYLNNSISREDCIELLNYFNDGDPHGMEELIDAESFDLDQGPEFSNKQSADLLNKIKSDPRFSSIKVVQLIPEQKFPKFHQSTWLKIAAAALIFFTAGLLLFQHQKNSTKINTAQLNNNTAALILPGSKKATLTTGNGKVILLNDAANGVLDQTNAGNVVKTNAGQIVYRNSHHSSTASPMVYNTLSTPKGGEYQLVLPDGTKIWLNAASSITYPTAFNGKERRVTLTGEAYFEVAKNREKPFYVNVNNTQIRVLGTHFNIEAYDDDTEMTTTLLEGSVQVTKNQAVSVLQPGQKAVIPNNSDKIAISTANIREAIAWKNGYFIFDDENITGIMKKVSRWYDVSVSYKDNADDQKFGGTFYRTKSITELLQYLEKIGKVHFAVEGRRVIVMK
jgi:ferric-dicitrate binding protein FerR (iron transport regulator)